MSQQEGNFAVGVSPLEPMEQEYELKCKTRIVEKTYEDEQSMGKLGLMSRSFLLLIPQPSSETYRCLDAWMGPPGKRVELLARIDHPYHLYCRLALMSPKSQDKESEIEEYHFFMMSFGLSQMIIEKEKASRAGIFGRFKRDTEIIITTCRANDDHSDGCPTDGTGKGDDLYVGKRREHITGLETGPDRHGNPYRPLK